MTSNIPCSSSSAATAQNLSAPTTAKDSNLNRFDSQSKTELLLVIQLYLQSNPKYCKNARALFDAIEQNETIPMRYDVNGVAHPQSLTTYLNSVAPFAASLPSLLRQLCRLQTVANPSPVSNFLPIRFFTSRRNALDRCAEESFQSPLQLLNVVSRRPSMEAIHSIHSITALQSREIGRCVPMTPRTLFRKELLYNLHLHMRILGHLSSIFCVAFDRSGRFLFTGADDHLIKVWDAQRCLLRFTFRGHTGEIMDLSVSYDNTLLASSSVDKTIRVWCLCKGTALRIFRGHTGTVNTVQWVPPLLAGPMRYLLSAGNDCAVVFQRYNSETRMFEDPPIKFNERATGGARIISASHSPGGNLVIVGDTHQSIMMYRLSAQGIERLYEFQAHSDRIDTLVWSHHSLRFVSGSKGGTAKVWSLDEEGRWAPVELDPFLADRTATDDGAEVPATVALPPLQQPSATTGNNSRRAVNANNSNSGTAQNNVYKLTMLCWTVDDEMVISIGTDNLLRCWDWRSGKLLAKYAGHQNEVFCLNAHPIHKELIVSAGHDGLVIVWNVRNGKKLYKHRNENSEREPHAIYDCQITPDGTTIACVDAMGHLSVYGVGHNQEAKKRPNEQFFITDYKALEVDEDGRVVDADTGELPERLPPPPFVNADGTLLSEQDQRLVPGNDIASQEVIKPCAWLRLDIVPPLANSLLDAFRDRQMEINGTELAEFTQKHCLEPSEMYVYSDNNRRLRGLQRRGAIRRRPISAAAAAPMAPARRAGGVHYRLAEFLQNRAPRYILDNDYPEDENDRSYTASEDGEVEENDAFMLNGIGHDERSMSSRGTEHMDDDVEEQETDEEEDNEWEEYNAWQRANGVRRTEEEDENDSDYEVGRAERETVFRERSSWTVTGRRKRRPPRSTSADQQQGTSSQETNNNGHQAEGVHYRSARLRARAQRSAEEQQHQQQQMQLQQSVASSSSQQLQQRHRRYKTRQTAFINSSSEGEETVVVVKRERVTRQVEEEEEVNNNNSSSGGGGGRRRRHGVVKRKRRKIDSDDSDFSQMPDTGRKQRTAAADFSQIAGTSRQTEEDFSQMPSTSKQSFEHDNDGLRRSARVLATTTTKVMPQRIRPLRQRRTNIKYVDYWPCDDEEEEEE